jgi:hypothetical protein
MEEYEKLLAIFKKHTTDLVLNKPTMRSVELGLFLAEHAMVGLLVHFGFRFVDGIISKKDRALLTDSIKMDIRRFLETEMQNLDRKVLNERKEDLVRIIATQFQEHGIDEKESRDTATLIYHDLESFFVPKIV